MKKKLTSRPFILVNVFAFLICITQSFGQQVQSVIPASPTIATLKRFNDYPMDYSTGTIDISVPIHTIAAKDFSIPVNMSFNARGRMGSLNYSPLGVGWGLTCIDYITRELNGKPDEYAARLEQTKESFLDLGSGGTEYNNLFHEMYEKIIRADPERTTYEGNTITYPNYDVQPDIYSYKVHGRTGKYIVNLDGNFVPLTYSTLKFNAAREVKDESGNQFFFGTLPSSVENTRQVTIGNQQQDIPSAWYLSRIVTAAGDTITYNYESLMSSVSGQIRSIPRDYTMYTYVKKLSGVNNLTPNPMAGHDGALQSELVNTGNSYAVAVLTSIVFPTGKVEFIYSNTDKRLNTILIYSNASPQPLKTVEFVYVNTPGVISTLGNNNSISLSAMNIRNKNNIIEEQYSFEYYNTSLAYTGNNYELAFLRNVDWWGYCNANGGYVPVIPTDNDFTAGQIGSKDANEQMKLNGMLKKITYPTGGFTEFAYENNKCYSNGNAGTQVIDGPGLRIKEIKSSAGAGKQLIKRLVYSVGTLPYIPNPEDFRSQLTYSAYLSSWNANSNSHYLKKTYTPFPAAYVSKLYSMPVYYGNITEAQYDEAGTSLGRTEYYYNVPSTTSVYEDNYLKYVAVQDWTQSQLREKKIFKGMGPGASILEHTYNYFADLNYVKVPGINFIRKVDPWMYPDEGDFYTIPGSRTGTKEEELYARDFVGIGGIYTIINHPIESAITVKTKEVVIKYDDNGLPMTETSDYEYGNLVNVLPTKVIRTGSDGRSRVSQFKYTSDMAALGNVYASMISNRNMVNTLIEQTDFVGGVQTKFTRTNYYSPSSNLFVPQSIETKNGNGPLYTLLSFKRYNSKGGILEQQALGQPNEVYFWGYQEQFPVAKVVGADYNTALTKVAQADVNAATGVTSNDAGVRTLLNNLRTIPGAMVWTYTYDPSKGMTSQSDVNNRVTYYEYDDFLRLSLIRDHDNNVIKKINYKLYTSQ